jgi:hypothetical protein
MGLSQYMYRQYGVNVATLGVSGHHSYHHLPMMRELSSQQNEDKTIVTMDLEHVHYGEYDVVKDILAKPNFKFLVVDSVLTKTCRELSQKHKEIKSFVPPAEWMCDCRHLNDYGVVEYSKMLMEISSSK